MMLWTGITARAYDKQTRSMQLAGRGLAWCLTPVWPQ